MSRAQAWIADGALLLIAEGALYDHLNFAGIAFFGSAGFGMLILGIGSAIWADVQPTGKQVTG